MAENINNLVKPSLDWIPLSEEMSGYAIENNSQKFIRKCKENPVVPLGAMATVAALSYGLVSFYQENKLRQQQMMRLRIAAQLCTIIAASASIFYSVYKNNKN